MINKKMNCVVTRLFVKMYIGDKLRYHSDRKVPEGSKYPKLAISLHIDPNLLTNDNVSTGYGES
jgi:hypothetical protein